MTQNNCKMITEEEAERLANNVVDGYVNSCGCQTEKDVANVLMKLTSMCGLAMCAVIGQKESVARLQGTADYIAEPQHAGLWSREVMH